MSRAINITANTLQIPRSGRFCRLCGSWHYPKPEPNPAVTSAADPSPGSAPHRCASSHRPCSFEQASRPHQRHPEPTDSCHGSGEPIRQDVLCEKPTRKTNTKQVRSQSHPGTPVAWDLLWRRLPGMRFAFPGCVRRQYATFFVGVTEPDQIALQGREGHRFAGLFQKGLR